MTWNFLINGIFYVVSSFSWQPPHLAFYSANIPYYCPNVFVSVNGPNVSVAGTCAVDRIFANGFQP